MHLFYTTYDTFYLLFEKQYLPLITRHIGFTFTASYHNSSEHKKAPIAALTYGNWSLLFYDMFDFRFSHFLPLNFYAFPVYLINQVSYWQEIEILDIIHIGLNIFKRIKNFHTVDANVHSCTWMRVWNSRNGKVWWAYTMTKHWKITMFSLSLPLAACLHFLSCAGSSCCAATWCSPSLVIGNRALLVWKFSEWIDKRELLLMDELGNCMHIAMLQILSPVGNSLYIYFYIAMIFWYVWFDSPIKMKQRVIIVTQPSYLHTHTKL